MDRFLIDHWEVDKYEEGFNEEYFQDCKIIFQFSFFWRCFVCKHSCLEILNQKDILRNIVFRGGFILYSNLIHETEVSGNKKWTKNDFIIFPKKKFGTVIVYAN